MKALALQTQNFPLYTAVALGSAFLVFAALGPGLFSTGYTPFSWHYGIFDLLCHQDPQRSYFINGNSMAVCSRCIGFYISFFMGWMLMPAAAKFKITLKKRDQWLFTSAIVINLTDIAGNYFNFWVNTLHSRLMLGLLLGFSAALFLTSEFFKHHKPEV